MSANPHNARPELNELGLTEEGLTDRGPASTVPDSTDRSGVETESTNTDSAAEKNGLRLSPFARAASSAGHAPGHEALQALLAFSSLHEQIRQRRARETRGAQLDPADVWELEQFVLDEVLQLVAERALTLTGADGIAIALADGNAIVCRASAGTVAPETGARLDPNSGFSGACLRTGGIVRCDDSETDRRVDLQVCRRLGTRSIVAVPITSSRGTIGLLEAFSAAAYGFNDSDVRSLNLLAELILAAMKPEEENRLAEISQRVVSGESTNDEPSTIKSSEGAKVAPHASAVERAAVDEIQGGTSELDRHEVERSGIDRSGIDRTEVSAANTPPAVFQEYQENHKSRSALVFLLPLLLLAALVGTGVWWKLHHRPSPDSSAPASASSGEESQVAPQTDTPSGNLAPGNAVSGNPAAAGPASGNPAPGANSSSPLRQLVTGIWHVSSADSSTVIIDTQGEVQYEAHRLSDPERIYVDIHDTGLAPGLFGKTIEVGDALLARVRIAQPRKGVSRVVLETSAGSDFSVSEQSKPYRLVVEIKKAVAPEHGAVPDSPKAEVPKIEPNHAAPDQEVPNTQKQNTSAPSSDQSKTTLDPAHVRSKSDAQPQTHIAKFRLVLDAGHGGWDLGTVGRKGLMEKDLVLDIVQRVGKLVESRLGAEVIYTRQDDNYLPLEKRTEIANLAQADMFVSVHANYSEDSAARGAETYYTNTYSSVRARTSDAGTDPEVPENINWNNVDIREKVQQSRRFAVAVQQALHRSLAAQIPGMRNRGVKKASYVVLTGTSMPAILAEVSFVSSPADEAKLMSSSYRQSIAEALYRGIAQFGATTHHVNLASASSKPKGL